MVEVIGDIVMPSELVIPEDSTQSGAMTMSGALLFISGANLWFNYNSRLVSLSGSIVLT